MEYQFEFVDPVIRIVVSVFTIAFAVALLALIDFIADVIADQFQRLKTCYAALTLPLCFDDEYAGTSSKPILILPRLIPVKGL